MKVKFIGVPGEEHDGIVMYDHYMPVGKYVEIDDAFAQRKLAHHPHFHVKPGDEPEEVPVIEVKHPDAPAENVTEAEIASIEGASQSSEFAAQMQAEPKEQHGDTDRPEPASPKKVGRPRGSRNSVS